tara:strand:- start:734 stop:1741 length:1008 start_codon:yes stop_codon:yes gene_type:complete
MVGNILNADFPSFRGRRIRKSKWIRELTCENELKVNDLVLPIFLRDDSDFDEYVSKMPGVKRFALHQLIKELQEVEKLGIKAIALFPKVNQSLKTNDARESFNPNNLVCKALKLIRKEFPKLGVICDIALDAYTLSGHDGLLDENNLIDNDKTIKTLAKMALNFSESGCEIIAPSDMMDGRIKLIRDLLEQKNHNDICIISYSAKFCSQFYGPFRNALGTEKNLGTSSKETYQLNYKNRLDAIRNVAQDIKEGSDIIMVKPAGYYLDIVREIKNQINLPLASFQVSGEFSMIKLASENGILNYEKSVLESLNCIKRSGANFIFSYFAKDAAKWLS